MLRTTVLAAALLIAIGLLLKTVIAPVALKQDGAPSSADLGHPPTAYGAPAVVTAPHEPRR